MALRIKVLWLLTLVFAFFIGLATFKAFHNFDTIKRDRKAGFSASTRWIESEQHRHLAQARLVAFMAANQIRKGLNPEICRYGFVGMPGLDPEFGHFAIADPHGKVSCNSIPWLTSRNVASQDYFQKALQLVDIGVIGESDNHSPSQYRAIMARAMHDDGHVQEVILVAMDFSWVAEEIDTIHLPASGHLLVIDSKGTVIAGSPNLAGMVDRNISDSPFYRQVVANQNLALDSPGFDGTPSLVVARQFPTGAGNMLVVVDTPDSVLLKSAYHNLVTSLAVSLVEFFIILALVYYWSDRYFLRKIQAIEVAARKLAQGEQTARANLVDNDELGHLAHTFDAMADTIQADELQLKTANDELYRVNRALRVLSAGNKSLLLAKTEQDLLERICHDIVEEGGYLAAWIGFSGAERDKLLRTAAFYSKAGDTADQMDWNRVGNGLEPVITAIREDKAVVINDTSHESVPKDMNEQAAKFGYRSIVILPLHLEGKPLGALILCSYHQHEFGETQVNFLKETADDISFGIEMLRTKGEKNRLSLLEQHHEKMLRDSLEDALKAISLTIEMRDPYTSGHQRRVAALAKALATELGLSAEETHGIYLAAVVHDIGKINVPAEILVKPGRLTDMEYKLVQNHVAAGYEILKNIRFPWPIAEMVRQHHERLDGSGYPLGLQDGDILFGSRILAVADVVEAMCSHRPYRPELGTSVALQEIEKGRGSLYDEAVVDACIKLFGAGFKF
jgi:putative nucleotidyltransferase with HDIG domain